MLLFEISETFVLEINNFIIILTEMHVNVHKKKSALHSTINF
jgi:hypothetical protein